MRRLEAEQGVSAGTLSAFLSDGRPHERGAAGNLGRDRFRKAVVVPAGSPGEERPRN